MKIGKMKHGIMPQHHITNLSDTLWWAVVTIATVGYDYYYPVTTVGRIIAVCDVVRNRYLCTPGVGSLSQRGLQRTKSRLKSKTHAGILGDEEKMAIRTKIDETKS